MNQLLKDLAALRKECFTIESGLDCFDLMQTEPMTGEQSVRHALYLARTCIDKAIAAAEKKDIAYSFVNRHPWVSYDTQDAERYRKIKADVERQGSGDCEPQFTNPPFHLIKMRVWDKHDRCYCDIENLDAVIDKMPERK